jgi:hypothetical protein
MLTILFFALLLAIPAALGIMRWEGVHIFVPVFSLNQSRFSGRYSHPSKTLNAFIGLCFGGVFGSMLAFGIGLFVPTHMVAIETIKLTPIHQGGSTFYVGVSTKEVRPTRGTPYQASYYSFLREADGGMTLEKFRTDDAIRLYEDSPNGGKLIRFERAFLGKSDQACNLFACPFTSTRYEFHVPTNNIGTF